MALEAVLYQQGLLGHDNRSTSLLDNWSCWGFNLPKQEAATAAAAEEHNNGGSSSSNYYYHTHFLDHGYSNSLCGNGNTDEWDYFSPPPMIPSSLDYNHDNWAITPPDYTAYDSKHSEMEAPLPSWDLGGTAAAGSPGETNTTTTTTTPTKMKRRRARSQKNREEIENQRMTHIAVERNRRKQMNEYLAVLKSLMPDSYVQRGDQASIVGGAINFVKELEHNLQTLSPHTKKVPVASSTNQNPEDECLPYGEFFTFPQYYYTTQTKPSRPPIMGRSNDDNLAVVVEAEEEFKGDRDYNSQMSSLADIEVTMVESHANLKIRSSQRPKQLMKIVTGLQSLRLTILHLNVSTTDQVAFYTLSVKVEDDSKMGSVEEIATAVHQLLGKIDKEAR